MSDSAHVADVQEVGARVLGHLLKTEGKVSRVDIAGAEEFRRVRATTVFEAITWLFSCGYLGHNKPMMGWGNDDITDAGRRYLKTCQEHAMKNAN